MSEAVVITKVSPVLPLALAVSESLDMPIQNALRLLDVYAVRGPDGLKIIPEDAPVPPWLLRAMRGIPDAPR